MISRPGRFIIAAFLVAAAILSYPLVRPLVNHAFHTGEVHPVKPVAPPPGITYLAKVEALVFEMTNQARAARGLAPLIRDDELANAARAFSNDMLEHGFFDHDTPAA